MIESLECFVTFDVEQKNQAPLASEAAMTVSVAI
jgi:hypothetical protein